jgi:hypothetical protein
MRADRHIGVANRHEAVGDDWRGDGAQLKLRDY